MALLGHALPAAPMGSFFLDFESGLPPVEAAPPLQVRFFRKVPVACARHASMTSVHSRSQTSARNPQERHPELPAQPLLLPTSVRAVVRLAR